VAIAITGQHALPFWSGDERDAKFDAYDLKGLAEDLLEQFGLRGIAFGKREESTALFLESAAVTLGGKLPLGELGQLLPTLAKKYDLRDAVFLAEFNLDLIIAKRNTAKSFKPLPQFPSIRRDVAMLVPETTTHESVLQAVKQTKPANLENVELFDIFRGKKCTGRTKESGLCVHLLFAGKNFDRRRSERRAHENRGGVQAKSWRDGAGINFLEKSACVQRHFFFN